MDTLRDIVEVKELTDAEQVNSLLNRHGEWQLIAAGVGQNADNVVSSLYILGRPYREPVEFIN